MNRRDFALVPLRILVSLPIGLLFVASMLTLFLGPMLLGVFVFLLPAEVMMVVLGLLGLVVGVIHPETGSSLLRLSTKGMEWISDGDGPERLLAPLDWWMDKVIEPAFEWVWA